MHICFWFKLYLALAWIQRAAVEVRLGLGLDWGKWMQLH